jgi:S-methylmethionine-dependent homocysteine/selenocysteine methylase
MDLNILNEKIYLLDGSFMSGISPYVDIESVIKHPLWGSNLLYNSEKTIVCGHKDYIRGFTLLNYLRIYCIILFLQIDILFIAGVEFLTTCTYQASIEGFQKYLGLNYEKSYELIKKSVAICRRAITEENSSEYNILIIYLVMDIYLFI